MSYLVVIEKADNNWSAYVPDLPGCIATGRTRLQAYTEIQKAIEMHIAGLQEDGIPVPRAVAKAAYFKTATRRHARYPKEG